MDNQKPAGQLNNKERYDLKQQEKLQVQESAGRKDLIKKIGSWSLAGVVVVVLAGGFIWKVSTRPPVPESDLISQTGIHWHPELSIYMKGVKQEIPSNIGVTTLSMTPIHTHEAGGVIHLEFDGVAVYKNDVTLGQFFKNWDKDMQSFGMNIEMTVNGKESTEYESYVMHDKDKIELRYE